MAKTLKADAKEQLWRAGVLIWKLDKVQLELYNLFYNSKFNVHTWLLSRRFGKTRTLCVLALEQCIRKPNTIVKFASPTKIQVNNNVRPLFRQLLEDCPPELIPNFKEKDYIYYFPNGSEIQLAGTESGHAEKLRGGESLISIVDEAQDCDDLQNLVTSVLLPTTLTTNGKVILSGTPPSDFDHDFISFIEQAESRGTLVRKTIDDNSRLTKEQKEKFIEEMGGRNSDAVRRELYCEIVKTTKSVIPEFTPELEKEIIKEWPLPPYFDSYVAMDLGFKDLTALVFGYYDFRADKIIIQDEIIMDLRVNNNNLSTLVDEIKKKEKDLWFNHITGEPRPPYKRVSDNDLIALNEITSISHFKIRFEPTEKKDLQAAINNLREKLKSRQIIIHPRCKTLIRHLRNVRWKTGDKNIFARSPDDGHYDAAAACVYFIRNIDLRKNPYPTHYQRNMHDLYVHDKARFEGKKNQMDVYKRIFGIKK